MTIQEATNKVEAFQFPATAAYAYIYLDKQDAIIMQTALESKNYKTIVERRKGAYEVIFWPAFRNPLYK